MDYTKMFGSGTDAGTSKPVVQGIPVTPVGSHTILQLKNINQSYADKKNVIQDLNLSIEDTPGRGEFFVVLGESGCGKSTLLRYIAGIQTPTSGEILLNGKPKDPKEPISMVFQAYSSLIWMTVLENVALPLQFRGVPKKERNDRAMEMIKLVGLDGHQNKYAKAPELSGGQLQRVAIARSLIANPKVLLMDEPFGALDINTRLKMQDMLAGIWHKIDPTVILVTHDISEAVYLGDDVLIMSANPGRIVHHIKIDLPFDRTRALKRDKKFTDLVYSIEDKMVELGAKS